MQTAALILVVTELEHSVERHVRRERDPQMQRGLLAIYRHSRALRIALEQWQEWTDADARDAATFSNRGVMSDG